MGATLREMRVGKRTRGCGREQCIFFPTHFCQEGQLLAYNSRLTETINMKVSGKLNLIFYLLNLFQIRFLVDKVKKTKKSLICRIMKNFLLSEQPVSRNANSASICKFKSNPSILNRVAPQVLLHNLIK